MAEVHTDLESNESNDFVIITASANGGLSDVHGHKQLALTP
ncbi:hypothetical protein [Pseudomonas sp. LJDD11]|nr:hypothetical protein [Pseudomonas sp. LJDD11]